MALWMGIVLIGSADVSFAGATYSWEGGGSFSYLRGDYGQEQDSEIYYTALTVKRYFTRGDLTVTIPYLKMPTEGVTFVGGELEATGTGGGGSGLGDILLKGRYYAVEQAGLLPFIDLVGSLKFPTAARDKGLGTGEFDFTILTELAWRLGDSPWVALAELGYTLVGRPAGLDARNRWLYSLGLAYELDAKTTLSSYLDGRTAIFPGNEDPLSILLVGQYKFRPDLRLDAMMEFGLTDGAPDFGFSVGLRRRI